MRSTLTPYEPITGPLELDHVRYDHALSVLRYSNARTVGLRVLAREIGCATASPLAPFIAISPVLARTHSRETILHRDLQCAGHGNEDLVTHPDEIPLDMNSRWCTRCANAHGSTTESLTLRFWLDVAAVRGAVELAGQLLDMVANHLEWVRGDVFAIGAAAEAMSSASRMCDIRPFLRVGSGDDVVKNTLTDHLLVLDDTVRTLLDESALDGDGNQRTPLGERAALIADVHARAVELAAQIHTRYAHTRDTFPLPALSLHPRSSARAIMVVSDEYERITGRNDRSQLGSVRRTALSCAPVLASHGSRFVVELPADLASSHFTGIPALVAARSDPLPVKGTLAPLAVNVFLAAVADHPSLDDTAVLTELLDAAIASVT